MVNLSKKQKNNQNADFKKTKTKVGQKKQQPTLTFKAKSVMIPAQTISQDKEDEIVTHRHQSLKKLIQQAKHYSNTVRKDALSGMKELVTKHPEIISMNIGAIFETTLELLCDDDKPVRQTLYQLYSQLLQTATPMIVSPFVSLNIVYICAALSHIQSSIRVDALAFLNLWIDHFPALLRPYASQILPHYQNMLSTNMLNSISASKILFGPYINKNDKKLTPLQARVILLHSLNKFLVATLQVNNSLNLQFKESAPLVNWSSDKFNSFHMPKYTKSKEDDDSSALRDYYATATSKAAFFVNSNNISDIYNTKTSTQKDPNAIRTPFEVLQEFSENAMPLIVECWLEANPNMIHGQQDSNNVYCMELLLDILQKLFTALSEKFAENSGESHQAVHQEYFEKYQKDIHRYFMNHFPYAAVASDVKTDEMMISINVYLCIVMSVYFGKVENGGKMEKWMAHMVEWLTDILAGKSEEPSGRHSNAVNVKLSLLLPVLSKLLPVLPSEETRYDLLQAFNSFFLSAHAQSAIKQHCLQFIADILVPAPGRVAVEVDPELSRDWLLSFPKLLWQLQTNNLTTTSFLISTLSKYLRKFSDDENRAAEMTTLQSALIPFFFTVVKKKDKQDKIFGPFIRLPADIQLECLRLLYYLPQWTPNLVRALVAIVPHVESQVVGHLLEVACLRSDEKSSEDYLSFLFTVMVTNAAEKTSKESENDMDATSIDSLRVQKLNSVVDAICHSFPLLDNLASPLSISEQLLSQLMKTDFQFGLHHSLIRLMLASSAKYSSGVFKLEPNQLIPNSIYKVLPSFILGYLKEILGQHYEEQCLETIRKLFLQVPDLFSKLLHVIRDCIPGKDTERLIQFLDDLINEPSTQELMTSEQASIHQILTKAKKQVEVDRTILEQFESDMSVLGMMITE